jgi:hypothetical protein
MGTTVTSVGEGGRSGDVMDWCPLSCTPSNHPRVTARTGQSLPASGGLIQKIGACPGLDPGKWTPLPARDAHVAAGTSAHTGLVPLIDKHATTWWIDFSLDPQGKLPYSSTQKNELLIRIRQTEPAVNLPPTLPLPSLRNEYLSLMT